MESVERTPAIWTDLVGKDDSGYSFESAGSTQNRRFIYGESGVIFVVSAQLLPNEAKMNGATNPADRLTMMGTVTVGQGPDGANVWVINAFKDFKSAMGGINTMMTPQQKQARDNRRALLERVIEVAPTVLSEDLVVLFTRSLTPAPA